MGKTLAEKLLARASGRDSVSAGEIVTAHVDVCMVDDSLGPVFIEKELERLGNRFADKSRVVCISDHLTPSGTTDQAEMVATARRWAEKHGIAYYEGEGPCHQVLGEHCYDLPGTVLVGTDSHTVTAGAFGCFGTGIGSTEAIGVIMMGTIWLRVPETIEVTWNGTLPKGTMAKDIVLRTMKDIGHAGATYKALEYKGSTICDLPMDERMCISNMAVETGAKVGLIAPDEKTDEYLRNHGCTKDYTKLTGDVDAEFCARYSYEAEKLTPQVAQPHAVDNVCDVVECANIPIHQAYLGSCTGGRISDLEIAAQILKGRKVAKGSRLLVSPGSWRVYREAMERGYLETFLSAGGRILAPTCGACVGLHSGCIAAGENCVSATNRNFKGRMGSYDSKLYLASPATVAASAVKGYLADPREFL
jgi:3-isopropylmalate/(R)-2-methylmalate dehydratase large subunit